MWFGKLFGGTMGFVTGGPLGAMVGMAFGSKFDQHCEDFVKQNWNFTVSGIPSSSKKTMIQALFTSLGRVAKSEGRVTEQDIAFAETVMHQLQLSPTDREQAKRAFSQGKSSDYDLSRDLAAFRQASLFNRQQLGIYLGALLQLASLSESRERTSECKRLCQMVGIPEFQFEQIRLKFLKQQQQQNRPRHSHQLSEAQACKILGVSRSANMAEIKRAYRKLISQYHPDKFIAEGRSESSINNAKEKSQKIRAAYELLKREKQAVTTD
ncbi:MAG: co-chaperone DjlA [Proteobacteria bacterium]|nr:MAG: co-chaperone DjlA [Pseudomonadota bacterium]